MKFVGTVEGLEWWKGWGNDVILFQYIKKIHKIYLQKKQNTEVEEIMKTEYLLFLG